MRNLSLASLALCAVLAGGGCSSSAVTSDAGTCAAGTTSCTGTCANLMTSHDNCGKCGNACPVGQACAAGACVPDCAMGTKACGTECVNLQTDNANCGACGTACPMGQLCSGGMCAVNCQTGLVVCNGTCTNTKSDPTNCGACGSACPMGQLCSNGACAVTCATGTTNCSGVCANLSSDNMNCGMCAVICPAGQACTSGSCALTCQTGQSICGNACTNLNTDNANCGKCDTVCPAGAVCSSGTCATNCGKPLIACSGACVDVRFDPANCGGCGSACPMRANATSTCLSASCSFQCSNGFFDCDSNASTGCEVNGATDPLNCGACGRACAPANATGACTSGACGISACSTGFLDCDKSVTNGCEVNGKTDSNNCGACGKVCATGSTCCGGACVDLTKDTSNCGKCGNACATGINCQSSVCGGKSCADILASSGGTATSGIYTIVIGGNAVQVYCDMTTDGGGWTQILNLNTSDGHIMWWGNALWTDSNTFGTASASLTADYKSAAWNSLTGGTKLLLVVHTNGTYKGWKSFKKLTPTTLNGDMQGGDNTILTNGIINSSSTNSSLQGGERMVAKSTQLYANHCVATGGACTNNTTGSPDGDRIGSNEGTPGDNNGGGLGNWHDMGLCCGMSSIAGITCRGGSFRTTSEAQAGWTSGCGYGQPGYFGTDAYGPGSSTCSDNSCTNSNWAQPNGINYHYALFIQ